MHSSRSLMRRSALALFVLIASCAKPQRVEVKDAWTRDTIGRTANAAVFMTITSPTPDRLLSASTPIAKKTDLMTIRAGSGSMDMAYVPPIEVPVNEPVSLNPSGLHVWLTDLKEPLKAGQSFPMFLLFQHAGRRPVTVNVISPSAMPPE